MYKVTESQYLHAKKQLESLLKHRDAWIKTIEEFETEELDYKDTRYTRAITALQQERENSRGNGQPG